MKGLIFTETVLNFTKKIARCMSSPNTCDLADPVERRFAVLYVSLIDHGILRFIWANHARIADGAWRSNHPTHGRLRNLANVGFKTIISLRGDLENAPHRCEAESCAALGMVLVNVPMAARNAPEVKNLLELITVLGKVEKPFLIHCKSGADRTGIASAVYLMTYCGAKPSEARKQLSLRFLHFQKSSSGILDHVLNTYAKRLASGPISFLDWVSQEYDQKAVSASFATLQNRNRTPQSYR
jgi:protein tyrosine phosphatase (PTP) superfamily phosphohydrolase (DUF442 family)